MEEWRSVVGWEDSYQVSSYGNFRSIARIVPRKDGFFYSVKSVVMKQMTDLDGYLHIRFRRHNIQRVFSSHRVICQAFLPTWDPLLHVNHKDFNRSNNHIDNLEMCTHLENVQYSKVNLRYKRPSKSLTK